jgi:antitoxin ParD1/3/4
MAFQPLLAYIAYMNITLPPNQRKWLEAEVAAGRFASIDEAVVAAVSGLMDVMNDDFAWAKPEIEKARASVARGDVISGDEYLNKLAEKIGALRSSMAQ